MVSTLLTIIEFCCLKPATWLPALNGITSQSSCLFSLCRQSATRLPVSQAQTWRACFYTQCEILRNLRKERFILRGFGGEAPDCIDALRYSFFFSFGSFSISFLQKRKENEQSLN